MCRSQLSVDTFTEKYGNIAKALNYDGKSKYYGRNNIAVATLNLGYIGLLANKDKDEFWKLLDKYAELCHQALDVRVQRIKHTKSDVAPLLWQDGALARLDKGETLQKLVESGYMTVSLGYAGLCECIRALGYENHYYGEGKEFGLKVLRHLNDLCDKWKSEDKAGYSVYGSPIESTTYKFAKANRKRFGIIPNITDREYLTNSYHVNVRDNMSAFEKLDIEKDFQKLSLGGNISYVELPNLTNNIPAVLQVIQYIYDNAIYAELNTKSDYCMKCGYDGEIEIKGEEGSLYWQCPNCGNTDQNQMSLVRRVCGYLSSNGFNQGRTEEIKDRVLHLDDN